MPKCLDFLIYLALFVPYKNPNEVSFVFSTLRGEEMEAQKVVIIYSRLQRW